MPINVEYIASENEVIVRQVEDGSKELVVILNSADFDEIPTHIDLTYQPF